MARKLRFFRDQMLKAGMTPITRSASEGDLDVDSLEVLMFNCIFSKVINFCITCTELVIFGPHVRQN